MHKGFNVKKSVIWTVAFNVVQILAIVAILLIVLFTDQENQSRLYVEVFICAAGFLTCCGAAADIAQAFSVLRVSQQRTMLEEAYAQLETLNTTLRAQRHDFMNHLQVVNSLIEMDEHDEAGRYIERVYGDIQSVSKVLRTANPAVNALLQAKLGESEKRNVHTEVVIRAKWEGMPVPGWEMCRVLGNLIDNAFDALNGSPDPKLTITLGEDLHFYRFWVENNGPMIPEDARARIFEQGVTSKGEGRGMGLFIVRSILLENGGDIVCSSSPDRTVFEGCLPKAAGRNEAE